MVKWTKVFAYGVAVGSGIVAILTSPSVGLYIAPIGPLAYWWASRRDRAWPEALVGGLLAAGVVFLALAVTNRGSSVCDPGSTTLLLGQKYSCGGSPPHIWLLLGFVSVALGSIVSFATRHGASNDLAP